MEDIMIAVHSPAQPRDRDAVLVGVVSSGNCEVLLERRDRRPEANRCTVTVHTSAQGFAAIWEAVIADFAQRRQVGGLAIEINDAGATPAVVGLRLDQAIEAWEHADA